MDVHVRRPATAVGVVSANVQNEMKNDVACSSQNTDPRTPQRVLSWQSGGAHACSAPSIKLPAVLVPVV